MKKIVKYIRLHNPIFYAKIIFLIGLLKRKSEAIHILDTYGGSFKEYVCNNDIPLKLERLKLGLDSYSIETIDVVFKRILNYPEKSYNVKIRNNYDNVIGDLLKEELPGNRKKVNIYLKDLSKQIRFSRHIMDASVFYYYHGLKYLPQNVFNYIEDTHFLDLGAFSGDSAIALRKYNYKKIFSIEMSQKAIENYYVTMKNNGIDKNKFEVIKSAIVAKDDSIPLYFKDNSYTVFTDQLTNKENAENIVEQRSVDSLVSQYGIEPKLIKADIEGFGLECVKGAINTLIKYRPVLSLAIYHNPYEFFDTKPFLEDILDNYTFLVRKMAVSPFGLRCHAETILIAYPNEILK